MNEGINIEQMLHVIQKSAALLVMVFSMYLYILTRGLFKDHEQIMNEYGFKLKTLASMGLFIYYKNKNLFQRKKGYDQIKRVSDIFGIQRAEQFSVIHAAQKLAVGIASLNALSLILIIGSWDTYLLVFGGVFTVLVYYWPDKILEMKGRQMKKELLIDLPEFINSLILLMNAGLPFHTAVEKSILDRTQKRPLYRALHQLIVEIKSGKPIVQAYEDLAQRCRVAEITRFVSTIVQNLNKGTDDFILNLKDFSREAWLKRKEIARKHGEEAAAKLVFPMVMIFIAITMIVLAPAFLSMKI